MNEEKNLYLLRLFAVWGLLISDCCVTLLFLVPAGICHLEACSQSPCCVFSCVSKSYVYLPDKLFKFLLFSIVLPQPPPFLFFFLFECALSKRLDGISVCLYLRTFGLIVGHLMNASFMLTRPLSQHSLSWFSLCLVSALLAGTGCLWEIIGVAFGALSLMFCIFIYLIM